MKRKILYIALFLLASFPARAQIVDFVKFNITDFSGGMDSKDYADKLQLNQGADISNGVINSKGEILIRTGQSLFNIDTNSNAFTGLGKFDLDATTSYMMAVSGSSVVRSLSTGTQWTIVNSGKNLTTGVNAEFIQANSLFFVLNGQDPTSWYDGTTYTQGGTWPGSVSPPTATTASWLNNYLFLAGNSTHPDWLYVSDNLTPQSFQANQVIKINTGDGQGIKKILPYKTGDLIIYKSRSIFDLSINNVDSTCSPQPICQWSYSPVVSDVGTPAPRSVVSLGNDQWFLSSAPYGVRSMTRSQFDKIFVNLISQPIQDIFDGTGETIINTVQIAKSAAIYYDNKYILAIPTSSSTVNNLVCVYDFITQSWYLITGWYPAEWLVDNRNNLYYIDANDGRVVQCFTGSTGDIGTTHPVSGPTVGIDFSYTSKITDFDNPDNFKQLDSIGLEFTPTGNYSATVSINLDNAGWQTAGSVALTSNAVNLPVTLPFTLTSPGLTYRTLQLTQYGEFKKIQVMVEINGTNKQIALQKITIFARLKPWRRE